MQSETGLGKVKQSESNSSLRQKGITKNGLNNAAKSFKAEIADDKDKQILELEQQLLHKDSIIAQLQQELEMRKQLSHKKLE